MLDDRARTYDPDHNALIRPLNRWWIREQFNGATRDVFVGYAVAYQEEWVAGAEEARTVVSCVDEFKRLTAAKLPTTNPPRDSYQDLAAFDKPSLYWPLLSPNWNAPAIGSEELTYVNGLGLAWGGAGAISGQAEGGYMYTTSNGYVQTNPLNFGSGGDVTSLAEFTIEAWLSTSSSPAATESLIRGPFGIPSNTYTWRIRLNTSRNLILQAKNSSGTEHTATSTTALSTGASLGDYWYHVVGTITGGNLRLYVNGVQEDSTAWTGAFEQIEGEGADARIVFGDSGTDIGANFRGFDEVAFYTAGLAADRVAAHYAAGRNLGFPRQQEPGDRITAVLAAISSSTARSIRVGTNNMTAAYMVGQSALDEIRRAEQAEYVDAVFFVAKDGTITFLDAGHRSASPWNTVQVTFDDTDTEWWYQDIGTDYSDSFIANRWHVTREGGTTQSASDSTSITQYGDLAQSVTGLAITSDSDAAAIATAMVAKYKDPMRRVTRVEKLAVTPDVIDNLLQREIGDRIRILRHPPGGGSAKDQTAFIQKIEVEAEPGRPRRFVLSVSPL